MAKFDETTLRDLSWDNLKAVAKENGVRLAQKREKITEELLKIERPKMTQLAKLRGDKNAIKMEKIRRRTVGHVKTPPRPPSGRGAGARRSRASTSRRAPEPQPEPQPQPGAVEAPTPIATPSEKQGQTKPEKEVRPLERARALLLEREKAGREKAEQEKESLEKEEAVTTEDKPPSAAAPGASDEVASPSGEEIWPPGRRPVLVPMGVHVPFNPEDYKPKHTQTVRRENWPDDWRVGLLSPDPNNPRPVFSPPPKPRVEPTKENEVDRPVTPVSEVKEVECTPVAEEPERVEDSDTETELAEEEEVFELTSIDDIHVMLSEEDKALDHVGECDQSGRAKKRKAQDEEYEQEGNEERAIIAFEQSPKKRRRTGLRGWLSRVF